jgi:hypothetical protein
MEQLKGERANGRKGERAKGEENKKEYEIIKWLAVSEAIAKCKRKQRLLLRLQSGNVEEVLFYGYTSDSIIVQSPKQPYLLRIQIAEIKAYKINN